MSITVSLKCFKCIFAKGFQEVRQSLFLSDLVAVLKCVKVFFQCTIINNYRFNSEVIAQNNFIVSYIVTQAFDRFNWWQSRRWTLEGAKAFTLQFSAGSFEMKENLVKKNPRFILKESLSQGQRASGDRVYLLKDWKSQCFNQIYKLYFAQSTLSWLCDRGCWLLRYTTDVTALLFVYEFGQALSQVAQVTDFDV